MGRGSLPKPLQEKRTTAHVSAPSYIVAKRPRKKSRQSNNSCSPKAATRPLEKAWNRFESDVNAALYDLRLPALDDILRAVRHPSSDGKVNAVCVRMGAAAAAGDRSEVFDAILEHVQDLVHTRIIRLQSAHHSTMSSVTQTFESLSEGEPVLVAVEDADLFPEDTLKDIVYICGKRQQRRQETDPSGIQTSVTIIFGLGSSVDPLHSALGIQEATMILPSNIEMPNATACFNVIVGQVLRERKHGIIFTQSVYDMVEREFFMRESTIATLMRTLHQMYTLHFSTQPLAAIFSDRDCWNSLESHAQKGKCPSVLSRDLGLSLKDCLNRIRLHTGSVQNVLHRSQHSSCSDEELCKMALDWSCALSAWTERCLVAETVVHKLLQFFQISEGVWRAQSSHHSTLKLHVFREFLATDGGDFAVGASHLGTLLAARISKASKQQLRQAITCSAEAIMNTFHGDDEELRDILARLEELQDSIDKEAEQRNGKSAEDVNEAVHGRRRRAIAKGGAAAMMRRKQMLLNVQVQENKASVLKIPRDKLQAIFKDLMALVEPLGQLPLYETILFSDKDALQSLSGGLGGAAEPRGSFFEAMRQPANILGDPADNEIPDSAVAYRLLADGGRLKNLHDWFSSFSSMRTAGAVERDEEGNIVEIREIPQAEMQARFARTCSELEFLGLLKYTNRKTDHVLRLTFE